MGRKGLWDEKHCIFVVFQANLLGGYFIISLFKEGVYELWDPAFESMDTAERDVET